MRRIIGYERRSRRADFVEPSARQEGGRVYGAQPSGPRMADATVSTPLTPSMQTTSAFVITVT
jgi:hypothetical protein